MTTIEWTDETWNPTTGCDRVSPGCDNCYALTLAKRLKGMGSAKYQADGDPRTSGPGFKLTVHPDTLDAPLRWRKPRKVFVNSMSDLFHVDVPDEFIAQVFAVMALTPQHTYQVLTKRPQRMASLFASRYFQNRTSEIIDERWAENPRHRNGRVAWLVDGPLPNVWLGTSIENDRYGWRAHYLRATPAAVRFISAEPLLGPLPSLDLTGIDWLIVGGESGPGARPMHPDWVRDLRDRSRRPFVRNGDTLDHCETCGEEYDDPCTDHRVAFFFKQWGGRTPKANGRDLDGRTWDEYPAYGEQP